MNDDALPTPPRAPRPWWHWVGLGCLLLSILAAVPVVIGGVWLGAVFHAAGASRTREGAEAQLKTIGVEKVVAEARALADRTPSDTQVMDDDLPAALAGLDPIYVWVLDDKIMIKIWGMGDWAGFVIPRAPGEEILGGERVAVDVFWQDPITISNYHENR